MTPGEREPIAEAICQPRAKGEDTRFTEEVVWHPFRRVGTEVELVADTSIQGEPEAPGILSRKGEPDPWRQYED